MMMDLLHLTETKRFIKSKKPYDEWDFLYCFLCLSYQGCCATNGLVYFKILRNANSIIVKLFLFYGGNLVFSYINFGQFLDVFYTFE